MVCKLHQAVTATDRTSSQMPTNRGKVGLSWSISVEVLRECLGKADTITHDIISVRLDSFCQFSATIAVCSWSWFSE